VPEVEEEQDEDAHEEEEEDDKEEADEAGVSAQGHKSEKDDDDDDKESKHRSDKKAWKRDWKKHGKKAWKKQQHKKCHGKHAIVFAGFGSLLLGFLLCRWIACKKVHQLINFVVPAVCAEHHLYTSNSRPTPVAWSIDPKSICKYGCKNNALKLVLDLHTTVPVSRQVEVKQFGQPMVPVSSSAYVPLNTADHA